MNEEQQLAHLSKTLLPKGCRFKGCYGRGHIGRISDEYVRCPKCTGRE